MEILDTAGQEEYTALRDQWMKDGEAFLLVYSITSRSSFTRISSLHRQLMKVKGEPFSSYAEPPPSPPTPPVYIIVGNKCDLVSDREVSTQEGHALARELGCPFIEASAKRVINVEKAFYDLIRLLRKQRKQQLYPTAEKIPLSSTPNTIKGTRSWWRKGISKAFGKSTPLKPKEWIVGNSAQSVLQIFEDNKFKIQSFPETKPMHGHRMVFDAYTVEFKQEPSLWNEISLAIWKTSDIKLKPKSNTISSCFGILLGRQPTSKVHV